MTDGIEMQPIRSRSEMLNVNQLHISEPVESIRNHVSPPRNFGDSKRSFPSGSNDDTASDANSEQDLSICSQKNNYSIMPNKSQVLFYLSDASQLRIRRAGAELQITDSIDFPLFDIWFESECFKSTCVIESYGRTVLLISENFTSGCFLKRKAAPPIIELTDWNGDLFGFFVPGDPFLLEDGDKKTIAKLIAVEKNGRNTVWICILESSGREIARLEDYSTIQFAKEVGGFQIKLLTLAAFARIAASQNISERRCCCSFFFSLL